MKISDGTEQRNSHPTLPGRSRRLRALSPGAAGARQVIRSTEGRTEGIEGIPCSPVECGSVGYPEETGWIEQKAAVQPRTWLPALGIAGGGRSQRPRTSFFDEHGGAKERVPQRTINSPFLHPAPAPPVSCLPLLRLMSLSIVLGCS